MILPTETIIIGEQEWMSTNLDVNSFRNGIPIHHAANEEEWEYAAKNHLPAYCHYENNHSLGLIFGKLYNYYAVIDFQCMLDCMLSGSPRLGKVTCRMCWHRA